MCHKVFFLLNLWNEFKLNKLPLPVTKPMTLIAKKKLAYVVQYNKLIEILSWCLNSKK